MKNKRFAVITIIVLLVLAAAYISVRQIKQPTRLSKWNGTDFDVTQLEAFIEENMAAGKIPGASVVIVKDGEEIYKKCFGYADITRETSVSEDTLFELGSTSKAFTALSILNLQQQGQLNIEDIVTEYIPWFRMKYEGEYADITIAELLHHTSGIPFRTIADIPVDCSDEALENTVTVLTLGALKHRPGEHFEYATINYDVLGLIVQEISGMPYETFVDENILKPLGLYQTFLFRQEGMAQGYKIGYLAARHYQAPIYRGNTPAGYLITNINDMSKWLKIQIGEGDIPHHLKKLIDQAHLPDRSVAPLPDGSSYAYGWHVYQRGSGEIAHGGENPNYSSYISVRPADKTGIAILTNLNSSYTKIIGQGIMDNISGVESNLVREDFYQNIDHIALIIISVSFILTIITLFHVVRIFIQLYRKQRKFQLIKKQIYRFLLSLIFVLLLFYNIYLMPQILFQELSWNFIRVWGPDSIVMAVCLVITAVVLFCLYMVLISLFPKSNSSSVFYVSAMSLFSGLGNALIIFTINAVITKNNGIERAFDSGLFIYFMMSIGVYIICQIAVRKELIIFTNNIIYTKRLEIIRRFMQTPYENIEDIECEKILSVLNNDTETISNFGNVIITSITSLVTLICCFIYLGVMNFYGLILSIFVIIIVAGLYYYIGRSANKQWEEARDVQDMFFKLINDMVYGFKELSLNFLTKKDFLEDAQDTCLNYKEKRNAYSVKFANVVVIGELLFTLVIGIVAFAFPIVFRNMGMSALHSYIFVFLYITGPVNNILNNIPVILQIRVSWKRLLDMSNQLKQFENDNTTDIPQYKEESLILDLQDICYNYVGKNGGNFAIGPISSSFKSGEITFIIGGNGSGKSTLAKIITGLYHPKAGVIQINGRKVERETLSIYFSAVFYDFYLFEKLYGIDYQNKTAKIDEYLKLLKIDDKVKMENGKFTTIKLSSGQKKRLALLIKYLEDREIFLFDEWAADQDPEFKKYFYHSLLPKLKNSGKCIIAITHDESYFYLADHIIKMEMGKIV